MSGVGAMTQRIRVLPELLVNQIAAGEVIERPASVVKELVENALDAGARRVRIRLVEGGRKEIVVADDGWGICAEDVPLAVAPHATSKLEGAEDLFRIRTLGFRGEALASIGSVANVRIVTCRRGEREGVEIEVLGGREGEVRPAARDAGTTVEVRSLFFHTPARRKFLRKPAVETSYAVEAVTLQALAHPEVAFEMEGDGGTLLSLSATTALPDRIEAIHGREFRGALLTGEGEAGGLRVRVYAAPPAFARSNTKGQVFLVNGRPVKDRMLTRALMESYRGLLLQHPPRYPVAVVVVEMPADRVDVNVHPAKAEVRFREPWPVHDLILRVLRETLLRADLRPDLRVADPSTAPPAGEGQRRSAADFFLGVSSPRPRETYLAAEGPAAYGDVSEGLYGKAPRPAFQVHDRYIVEETDDGMAILDQHALHEKVLLADLREALRQRKVHRQKLLVPVPVDLDAEAMEAFEAFRPHAEALGFELEPFGRSTVAVTAVPHLASGAPPEDLLPRLIETFRGAPGRVAEEMVAGLAATLACRSAVRAGDRLQREEIRRLLDRRASVTQVETCAHGRPTMLVLTLAELERHFGRKP